MTDSDDCVDVERGAPENDIPVVLAPCDDRLSEQWLIIEREPSLFELVNRQTSKCLDVDGNKPDAGLVLQQYSCNLSVAQRWRLLPSVPKQLPLVVDEHFFVTTWTGTGNTLPLLAPSSVLATRDCDNNRAPDARGDCHIVSIETFPPDAIGAGASWLNFPRNWSAYPGLPIAAGAARIVLRARGERGGERVIFHATDPTAGAFPATYQLEPQEVVLTTSWQGYSFDLSEVDYSAGVSLAVGWHLSLDQNTAPLRFYIDDIAWE